MTGNQSEFASHPVFEDLKAYIAFYEHLSRSVFSWITQGTGAFCNIDSYVYSSIQGTLSSIDEILRNGRVNDAYALLRKYYDSATINIYSILYLEDHFSIENFIVKQIDNWLKGKEKLPEFRIMAQYIRSSKRVAAVTDILLADDRYMRLRERCNDHTHYNFYKNVLLNDNEIHLPERRPAMDEFQMDIRDVFVFHVACVFCVRDNYMMASDHLDALELGLTALEVSAAERSARRKVETSTSRRNLGSQVFRALTGAGCLQAWRAHRLRRERHG
jgi:hypothetical protein